jgi:hypothetical protein
MVPSDVMNDTRKPHTFFIVIGQNKTSEYVMKLIHAMEVCEVSWPHNKVRNNLV